MEICKNATTSEHMRDKIDLDLLLYIEYAYGNIGFMPKWLNITTY